MIRCILLLLLCFLLGCGSKATPSDTSAGNEAPVSAAAADPVETPAASADASAVELKIVDFDGIQQLIASKRGKVVVMDAWSTSCPPCIKEFHNLVDLHKQHGPEQVACVSLSFDYEGLGTPEEQLEPVLKFLQGQGATFDNLLSSEESDVLYRKFKLAAVPAVFVYDRAGQLRKRFDNEQAKSKEEAFTYEQVRQLVSELLAENPPAN